MKKLLFPVLAAAMLASCGDDGGDPDKSNYITHTDMEGVRLVYTITDGGKTGNLLMTVDAEGNTAPFHFITEQGDRVAVDTMGNWVSNSRRLSNDYMILSGRFYLSEIPTENLIVNTRTGELCPTETDFSSFGHEAPTFEDGSGNIYIIANGSEGEGIFRINLSDPSKPEIEKYTAGNIYANHYLVNSDGVCFYRVEGLYYVKLPYGGIHEVSSLIPEEGNWETSVFCGRNGQFYIAASCDELERFIIYEFGYSQEGSADGAEGDLQMSFDVAEVAELDGYPTTSVRNKMFCRIPQTGKHLFVSYGDLVVFDEDTRKLSMESVQDFPSRLWMGQTINNNVWTSSGTLWVKDNGNGLGRTTASGGYAV